MPKTITSSSKQLENALKECTVYTMTGSLFVNKRLSGDKGTQYTAHLHLLFTFLTLIIDKIVRFFINKVRFFIYEFSPAWVGGGKV